MKNRKNKKKWVYLPLEIPMNIRNCLSFYFEWKKKPNRKSEEKTEIFRQLCLAANRWHLYNGFEAVAGLVIIHTTVGVDIIATQEYPAAPYNQVTNEAWFAEYEGRVEGVEEKTLPNGQKIKYVR